MRFSPGFVAWMQTKQLDQRAAAEHRLIARFGMEGTARILGQPVSTNGRNHTEREGTAMSNGEATRTVAPPDPSPPLEQKMKHAAKQCLASIIAENHSEAIIWRMRWNEMHVRWVQQGNRSTSLIASAGGWSSQGLIT